MQGESDLAEILLPPHAASKAGNDVIYAWLARYQRAAAEGKDVVNGTIGALLDDEGELVFNPAVAEAIARLPDLDKGAYSPLPGLPAYRNTARALAIGPRLKDMEMSGFATESVASPGGCGALYLSARNMLSPGDSILVRSTYWGPYRTIADECGLGLVDWPLVASSEGEKQVDKTALSSRLDNLVTTQGRVLAWLNDPAHNPTGMSLDSGGRDDVMNCFLEAARANPEAGFTLLLDTAYALYADEPHGWTDTVIPHIENWPDNLLLCWAFSTSKSHTIYGLRCGAIVFAHPDRALLDRMVPMFVHTGRGTWSGSPRLPQAAVAMIHADAGLETMWDATRAAQSQVLEIRRQILLDAAPGVHFDPSNDGYFAHVPDSDPVSLCEEIAKHGVYVVPLAKGVRIGVCSLPTHAAERVGRAISEAWTTLGRRP
ncbi:MAG: aminotransferase class I/II-fold pyridoxal phosphate-dependent enzyme [Candidatus Thermoplasmatota archaeon]|nr:aminotransferase class I/II-fold pyridoxal phosphate-dependent enzyme [Candidatus Thermoplasmatota archaeon]